MTVCWGRLKKVRLKVEGLRLSDLRAPTVVKVVSRSDKSSYRFTISQHSTSVDDINPALP